jgi:hypothetical protein
MKNLNKIPHHALVRVTYHDNAGIEVNTEYPRYVLATTVPEVVSLLQTVGRTSLDFLLVRLKCAGEPRTTIQYTRIA